AGECCIAFGLNGPALAVGGGPHGAMEALAAAASLVAAGDCEAMVVAAVDETGQATRELARAAGFEPAPSGAVAALVAATDQGYAAIVQHATSWTDACDLPLGVRAPGHLALLPLAAISPPERLGSRAVLTSSRGR